MTFLLCFSLPTKYFFFDSNVPEFSIRTNPDHETPITSPNCMTSPNGNIGTDTEEGGMESDNDSMDNCQRKRLVGKTGFSV